MAFGLGGLVSSIGGFLGTSGGSALAQTVLNGYYNRKAAAKQNKYTYSLIDYENAYNDPLAVRERLENAGYNPNLALNGVNVQSATGSAPTVQPARLDLLSAYNLEQQNELLRKQTELTEENAARARTENLLAGRKSNLLYYQDKYAEQEYEAFKKTGKIPESYYKNMNAVGTISKVVDQLLQYISN